MDGKEAIINKILEDAKIKAAKILEDSASMVSELKKDAIEWAKEYTDAQNRALDKEAKEIVERRLTVAELEVRKTNLADKQALIDDAFKVALDKLCSLGKTYYSRIVFKMIAESAEDEDTIIMSKDGVLTEQDFVSQDFFKAKNLKISAKKGDFSGGVKLVGVKSDKDLTFSAVIESFREENTAKVAEILF